MFYPAIVITRRLVILRSGGFPHLHRTVLRPSLAYIFAGATRYGGGHSWERYSFVSSYALQWPVLLRSQTYLGISSKAFTDFAHMLVIISDNSGQSTTGSNIHDIVTDVHHNDEYLLEWF